MVLVFAATLSFAADPKRQQSRTPPAKACKGRTNRHQHSHKGRTVGTSWYWWRLFPEDYWRTPLRKEDSWIKKIIPGATYDKMKDKIIAKQVPKKK